MREREKELKKDRETSGDEGKEGLVVMGSIDPGSRKKISVASPRSRRFAAFLFPRDYVIVH